MENIIAVKCPKCGGDMELPVDALGGHVRCPYCNVRSSAEVVVRPLDGMGGADDAMKLNIVCTGQEYEEAIFNHLVQAGYNCLLTARTGDQGVDIIVNVGEEKVAIQCKLYTGSVGNEAVQQVIAGARYYKCTQSCVVTNSSYTTSAHDLAKSSGVRLLRHGELIGYLGEFSIGFDADDKINEGWEATEEYLTTVHDAEKGFDVAREKLGQYYCSKAMERARFDLREAGKYFEMACKWGNEKALAALCQKLDGDEDESTFPPILGEVADELLSTARIDRNEDLFVEYYWFLAKRDVKKAMVLPLGHKRDDILEYIYFPQVLSERKTMTPKEMFYLGVCKMKGWGCKIDKKAGRQLLQTAAQRGYLKAEKWDEGL